MCISRNISRPSTFYGVACFKQEKELSWRMSCFCYFLFSFIIFSCIYLWWSRPEISIYFPLVMKSSADIVDMFLNHRDFLFSRIHWTWTGEVLAGMCGSRSGSRQSPARLTFSVTRGALGAGTVSQSEGSVITKEINPHSHSHSPPHPLSILSAFLTTDPRWMSL